MNAGQSYFTQKLSDRLCFGNADALASATDQPLASDNIRAIVLDMEYTRLCDSYGIRFLVGLHRRLTAASKRLILYRPYGLIVETLRMVNLLPVFTIAATPGELDGLLGEDPEKLTAPDR